MQVFHISFNWWFFFFLPRTEWYQVSSGLQDSSKHSDLNSSNWSSSPKSVSPVSWGSNKCWLHLCRGVRPPTLTSVLDITLNHLMVWRTSVSLLPGPLWTEVVELVRVVSMGQIELFHPLLYLKPFECV